MAEQKSSGARKKASAGGTTEVVMSLYDPQSIADMALKVKSEGFVPADVLKAEFGPEKFTRGIAVLYRDFRMFREVRRPWTDGKDAVGYEWADRRFTRPEAKKIPPALSIETR